MTLIDGEMSKSDKQLKAAFDDVIDFEARKKELTENINETIDAVCMALNISKRAFKVALKWYSMSDGERADFETALQVASRLISQREQKDMFDFEAEADTYSHRADPDPATPGRRRRASADQSDRKKTDRVIM